MRLLSFLGAVLICASSAFGQLSFGIKGGAPITDSVLTNPSSFTFNSAKKYIIGGLVEFGLPFGLSVEGDVLYHPFNLEVGNHPPPGFSASTLYDYKVFEFPVVVKARFTEGLIRPYLGAGPTFRGTDLSLAHYGITAGGGLEIGTKKLIRISPEIRYTRWGPDSLIDVNGSHISAEQLNQLAVYLSVTF